ncbi:MAG: hypothetical protein E4H01_15785 [Lysobacterales bacterium]|nr:MAG: hypothetical protein E4H01_15785 [Xanthomonadales bacterium]
MSNGTTSQLTGWIVGIAASLAIAGIIASINGYANDGKQDVKIERNEQSLTAYEIQLRELQRVTTRTDAKLESIDDSLERLAKAVEQIADKKP